MEVVYSKIRWVRQTSGSEMVKEPSRFNQVGIQCGIARALHLKNSDDHSFGEIRISCWQGFFCS